MNIPDTDPKITPEVENWRAVAGFANYEVSDLGRVRKIRKTGELILHQGGKIGATRIILCVGGRKIMRQTHCLVLEAFVGPRPPGMLCRHLDANLKNNRLSNLAWGSRAEDAADKRAHPAAAKLSKYGPPQRAYRVTPWQLRQEFTCMSDLEFRDRIREIEFSGWFTRHIHPDGHEIWIRQPDDRIRPSANDWRLNPDMNRHEKPVPLEEWKEIRDEYLACYSENGYNNFFDPCRNLPFPIDDDFSDLANTVDEDE